MTIDTKALAEAVARIKTASECGSVVMVVATDLKRVVTALEERTEALKPFAKIKAARSSQTKDADHEH